MEMGINVGMKTGLEQTLSPQLLQSVTILQKTSLELETAIRDELESNPLLEVDESVSDEDREVRESELEGSDVNDDYDAREDSSDGDDFERGALDMGGDFDDYGSDRLGDGTREDDASFNEVNMMRESPEEEWDRPIKDFGKPLQEQLEDQLGIWKGTSKLFEDLAENGCDETHFRELVKYIISSVDEDGFLSSCDEDKISGINSSDKFIVEIEKVIRGELDLNENSVSLPVHEAFHVLHGFSPSGVGARNQRECFLIQANRIPGFPVLGIKILENCYEDLLALRYAKIGKTLGVSTEEVQAAVRAFARLSPHPGFQVARVPAHTISVDLKLEEKNGKLEVKSVRSSNSRLRVNSTYKALANSKSASKEDKAYIRAHVAKAEEFIKAVNNRYSTMEQVMGEILKRQKDFFTKGPAFLKPMVLQDIADEIGKDVSTVNRVTNGKFVDTPYGIFELKRFFTSGIKQKTSASGDGTAEGSEEVVGSAQVIDAMKKMIDEENKKKPLSDQVISDKLAEMGMKVARRTVAKYRENVLHVLTASQRKQ